MCLSTHRAPGSACSRAAPTCAGVHGRFPSSSRTSSASPPSAPGPAGRSSIRSARSAAKRTRRSSMPPDSRSSRSATSGRSSGIRGGRSSCSRSRTCTTRRASSSRASQRRVAAVGWNEWIRTVEVEPSLYAADFAHLGDQIDVLLRAGVRIFHFDVGDGHFVEPVTIGPIVLQSISPAIHDAGGYVDCHLMTAHPEKHFEAIAEAGGDSVTVDYEACEDLPAVVRAARALELEVGLAFKPETSASYAAHAGIASSVDIVLCMSIEPGHSGQEFMPEALERIRTVRSLVPRELHVQVD